MEKRKELYPQITRSHKEAKRLAYEWLIKEFEVLVEKAISRNDSFAYEGHFTNDATWDIPKRFKINGYSINLIFFGLANPDLSELRVIDRVKEGGHYVPRFEVESNFYGNLEKLNQYFELMDDLRIVDTSEATHVVLAHFTNNKVTSCVSHEQLPDWFVKHLPDLLKRTRSN